MIDPHWNYAVTLAAIPVVLIATRTFGQPSWSRSYTMSAFYRGAWLAYVMLYVLVLVTICATLNRFLSEPLPLGLPDCAKPTTLSPGQIEGCALAHRVWTAQFSVWIGLAIVTLLSAYRPLARWPRTWLHRQAGIPTHAHRLAKQLAESAFEPDAAMREDASELLIARGIDIDIKDPLEPLAVPAERLLNATALFLTLTSVTRSRRFRGFLREADNEYYALRSHFDRLSLRIPRSFAAIGRVGEMLHLFRVDHPDNAHKSRADIDSTAQQLVTDLITDACKDIADFHEEACLFAARVALACRRTGKRRQRLLRNIGFATYTDDSHPTVIGVLTRAAVALLAGIWVAVLILPHPIPQSPHSSPDIGHGAFISMVFVIIITALSITIFIKDRWGFANAGLDGRTPIRFIVGAGLCASLFALAINLVTGALLLGGWHGAMTRLAYGWPYLHVSGATSAAVAWLVQDHRWRRTQSALMRRLLDALMLAAVWLLASNLTALLANIAKLSDMAFLERVLVTLENAPSILQEGFATKQLIVSVLFGAVLGAMVPESVRRAYPRVHSPSIVNYGAVSAGS